MTTRREFLGSTSAATLGLTVPNLLTHRALRTAPPGFLDLLRTPDRVLVQTAGKDQLLTRNGDRWTGDNGVVVGTSVQAAAAHVTLTAPGIAIKRIHLRWRGSLATTRLILGDAWSRGYGDLEWRGWVPDRVMPWYAATYDGSLTHAYGVRTGGASFCYWQIDQNGLSLWADVRSGGVALQLGDRTLNACDVVCRAGHVGESVFAALHAFCKQMCPNPRMPSQPVYGSNDWYVTYGNNSATSVRTDAEHIVELSPTGANRPYMVIDDGWQPGRGADKAGAGLWDRGNDKFGDMAALAADVRRIGARPGIWVRPLEAHPEAPTAWRLSRDKSMLDPSVPDVLHKVADDVGRLRRWGYELIKHDYTTYDIFGRWGNAMGSSLTRDGWSFAAGTSKTTAEVINELYRTIRVAATDGLIIGCDTMSHLSAGLFEACRIGDDTSGTDWSRTRRMGVNSLAFRAAQHGAFYAADPDCVPVTTAVPWKLTRQWLDLVARSGTMLFASLAPDALGEEQRRELKAALALAAKPQPLAEPTDWQRSVYPTTWAMGGVKRTYDWVGQDGAGGA